MAIYDSSGKLLEYNDDSFQDADSSIIDLTLPSTGTYYVMVTCAPKSAALSEPLTGDYELFMYTFSAGTTAAYASTAPGLGDTIYAGSGDDTIIAGSADDTIADPPPDTIVYGSGAVEYTRGQPLVERLGRRQPDGRRGLDRHIDRLVTRPLRRHASLRLARGVGLRPADRRRHRHQLHVHPWQRWNLHGDFQGRRSQLGWDSAEVVITSLDVPPVLTAPSGSQSTFAGVSTSIDLGTLATTGIGPFTGTVNWGDGQTSTFAPTTSGALSLAHTYAKAGTYTIGESVSEYFGGTTTASVKVDVTLAETTTTLTSSSASTVYGQLATFTATVAGPLAATGTVTFYAGAVTPADQIGTGTLSIDKGVDTATFKTSMLPVTGSPYTITAVYGGDVSNMTSTSSVVNLTITPAPILITAVDQSMTYGGTMPALTVSYSGLAGGDTPATFATSPNTAPTISTVPATSDAGSYAITVSGAYDPNYTIGYASGTLTIAKASAKIMVTPYSVTVDGNPHTASGTATGVETPTPANLSGLLDLSGTTHTTPGSYVDTWTFAGNTDYASTSGVVTDVIEQAALAVMSIATVSPDPRNSVVSSIDVTFNEPVKPGTFTRSALTLTDNGGSNLITSAVTVALLSGSTYQINGLAGLTLADGSYTLMVNSALVQDQYGVAGTNALSTVWLMDATAPTSKVSALPKDESTLNFPVSVTGTDGGSPPSGVKSYDIYSSTNGGAWTFWTTVPASSPTASFMGQSNTTYAFYSIAHDMAGNTEVKHPVIEASTYVPNLTPPVTAVDGTTGTNPSSVNTSTGTFTLDLTGSDPGGGQLTYFDVFVSIDGGAYTEVGPYGIPAGPADSSGKYHSTLPYQGLTDGKQHTYRFYSVGYDSNNNIQSAQQAPM